MNTSTITRQLVAVNQRINTTANLFGLHFSMRLEPTIYAITDKLAHEYNGGYWEFYALSNGGFYMAPSSDKLFDVSCENGFEGKLSGDALGIVACLYAYSHLSFGDADGFAEVCAEQYHLLREYMFEHSEVVDILRAID
jgi:hypothetical protein